MLRYEEATGETLGYLHACAVGGVLVADTDHDSACLRSIR